MRKRASSKDTSGSRFFLKLFPFRNDRNEDLEGKAQKTPKDIEASFEKQVCMSVRVWESAVLN